MIEKLFITAALAAVLASPVNAGSTALDLSKECRQLIRFSDGLSYDGEELNFCAGSTRAIMYGLLRTGQLCGDSFITVEQAARVFVKYADDHPEQLNKEGLEMMWTSLAEAFPCDAPE